MNKTTFINRYHNSNLSIAACVGEPFELLSATQDIQLTPAGLFRARDGRPEGLPGWYIDAVLAATVIEQAFLQKDRFLIDYEHQTLYAEKNGQPAPAAGWYKGTDMQWREGAGLFATNIEWTPAAAKAIANKEYRYISPVIVYNKTTGHILAVNMAALVNYAAIDGMNDIASVAAAKYESSLSYLNSNPKMITKLSNQQIALCRTHGIAEKDFLDNLNEGFKEEITYGLSKQQLAMCKAGNIEPKDFYKTMCDSSS